MNVIKKILKSVAIALAYITLTAGCAPMREAVEPDARPRKSDSVFLEETVESQGDESTFYHAAAFSSGGNQYAKVLIIDGEETDTVNFGARGNFDFGSFRGNAELIGFDDSENSHATGLNARGAVGNTTVGMALEKKVEAGSATDMAMAYARQKIGDVEVTGGIAGVDGDARGIVAVGCHAGQNFFGAGVNTNGDGEGYATMVAGRRYEERGEGFGCRLWAKVDLQNGDHLVDVIASTNTNISRGTLGAPISPDSGVLDPKLFGNRFDIRTYLWERGNGFVSGLRHSNMGGVRVLSADAMHHWDVNGVLPRVGIGYSRTDDGTDVTEAVRGNIGAIFKNGYVDVVVEGREGEKPFVSVVGGVGFNF